VSAQPVFTGHAGRLCGAPAGWSDVDNDDSLPFRRVACMMLLSGYLDAGRGDLGARRWVESPAAKLIADVIDLPHWPPRPDQFYTLDELERRATDLSGPVHASHTRYGRKLTDRERRVRRRAAHDSLFAQAAGTSATAPVAAVLSFWGQFLGVTSYTTGEKS
jgi:hypothetical protein